MRPYVCLIEVAYSITDWVVVLSDSRGKSYEHSSHRYLWRAKRSAHRLAVETVRDQGENLRLELHVLDKDDDLVVRKDYGRDPRSVR